MTANDDRRSHLTTPSTTGGPTVESVPGLGEGRAAPVSIPPDRAGTAAVGATVPAHPSAPGDRSDDAALRSPIFGAQTVCCPDCRGIGSSLIEGGTLPARPSVCPTCRGARDVQVQWASWQEEPQHTHLFVLGSVPADPLCPHNPVDLREVTGPTGAPCSACMIRLADLAPAGNRWIPGQL